MKKCFLLLVVISLFLSAGVVGQPVVNQNPRATLDVLMQVRDFLPQFERDLLMLTQGNPQLAADEVVISFMVRNGLERNEDLIRWVRSGLNTPGVRDLDRLFNHMALFTAAEFYLEAERPEDATLEQKQALVRLGLVRLNILAKTLKYAEVDDPPRRKAHLLGLLLWALVDYVDRNPSLVGDREQPFMPPSNAGGQISRALDSLAMAQLIEEELDGLLADDALGEQGRQKVVDRSGELKNALGQALDRSKDAKAEISGAAVRSGRFGQARDGLDSAAGHFKDLERSLRQFDENREAASDDDDLTRELAQSVKTAVRALESCLNELKDVLAAIE